MTSGCGHASEGRGQEVGGGAGRPPQIREPAEVIAGPVSHVARGQGRGRGLRVGRDQDEGGGPEAGAGWGSGRGHEDGVHCALSLQPGTRYR